MSYKTILTVLGEPGRDAAHLAAAIGFAEAEWAHLNVLALGVEYIPPEAYYGSAAAITVQSTITAAIEAAKAGEAAANAAIERAGVSGTAIRVAAQIGAVAHVVARHAALSDLVILPQPYGEGRGPEDVAVTEAALFSSRTPVLVLPRGMAAIPAFGNIVVAWNESTEALAAVRAALPLLMRAGSVNLAVIDPPQHGPDRADPGTELAEMLTRHGVTVEVSVVARTMPRVSDVIERHALDRAANLVVMGAYGHSRFREAILGGTTRNMLEKAQLPVLMAH